MNILNHFFYVYVWNPISDRFFFLIERIKLETVNKDNFFKEFCYKGDQRNEEMTGTILFNLQQQLFEVGAIIIIPFLQMYKL